METGNVCAYLFTFYSAERMQQPAEKPALVWLRISNNRVNVSDSSLSKS